MGMSWWVRHRVEGVQWANTRSTYSEHVWVCEDLRCSVASPCTATPFVHFPAAPSPSPCSGVGILLAKGTRDPAPSKPGVGFNPQYRLSVPTHTHIHHSPHTQTQFSHTVLTHTQLSDTHILQFSPSPLARPAPGMLGSSASSVPRPALCPLTLSLPGQLLQVSVSVSPFGYLSDPPT